MATSAKQTLFACLALIAFGFAVYSNTLRSPFFFDDGPSIVDNPFIESLWPLSQSFGAPPGAGSSGRPLVSFSLALNYAIGERNVLGYHLFNIATLVLSALALFGLARRLLRQTSFAQQATGLGFSIALLWMLHPLHTDTLNHVVYRNGAMMGFFYLLSLYCAARIFGEENSRGWTIACLFAATGSVACKEVAVSLPLAILALDRQFGAGGFVKALKQRTGLYVGLSATWLVLAICVMSGDRGESVGFEHMEIINGVDYFRTQMIAITTYLQLSGLAKPFVFDYDGLEVVRDWSRVLGQTALLSLGLIAALVGFAKKSGYGLLGLLFFVLLAPTSSFIPLAGEMIAEHRMYLPLVPLVAIAVLSVAHLSKALFQRWNWNAPALLLVCAATLGRATWLRNQDYESGLTLWQDTVQKVPDNPRAWNHFALALKDAGEFQEAQQAFLRTLEVKPTHGKASYNYGNLLVAMGDMPGALVRYRDAARHEPNDPYIRFNHGNLLVMLGEEKKGLVEYRAALELLPGFERPLLLLAWAYATSKDDSVRDGNEALRLAKELGERYGYSRPRHLDTLAAALAETGDFVEAEKIASQAARSAASAGQARLAQEIEARRALYQSGQAFREQ